MPQSPASVAMGEGNQMEIQERQAVPDLAPDEQELDPIFELGGPAFRFMQRIGIIKGNGRSIARRTVAFIAITWCPMLLFASLEGHAIGATARSSFLLDFATYARFFIAVPLIFAAESLAGPRIRAAGLRFMQSGIVQSADHPAFLAAAARTHRRRDSILPEIIFLAVAMFGAWFFTIEELGGLGTPTWYSVWTNGELHLTPAGLWYHFIAVPLVQFFLLRWLWRLAIWTMFLRDMSRLPLNLIATHSDRAAGLGFLGVAHVSLSVFPFALSCVLAAEIAFRVQFEGMDLATLRSMGSLLAAYLVFIEAVTFGPLLVLVPMLARVRLAGLRSYGILVQRHNQLFHDKWIDGNRPTDELPLGNADMSSLIDLGSSFDVVRQMSIFPVGRRQLLQVAVVACLPGIPLLFLVLPVAEVVKLLAGIIT
jgi:hypothetical protein